MNDTILKITVIGIILLMLLSGFPSILGENPESGKITNDPPVLAKSAFSLDDTDHFLSDIVPIEDSFIVAGTEKIDFFPV